MLSFSVNAKDLKGNKPLYRVIYIASTHTHTYTHIIYTRAREREEETVFPLGVQKITMKVQLNEEKDILVVTINIISVIRIFVIVRY